MKIIKLNSNLYINANNLISIRIQNPEKWGEDMCVVYLTVTYEQGGKIIEYDNWPIGEFYSTDFGGCIFCNNEKCPVEENISCEDCIYDKNLSKIIKSTWDKGIRILNREIEKLLDDDSNIIDFSEFRIVGRFIDSINEENKAIYEIYKNKDDEKVLYREEFEFKGYTELEKYKR